MPSHVADLLSGRAEPIAAGSGSVAEILSTARRAHAIIASSLIVYDGEVMDLVPELRVIARTGIGYDKVDLEAATARGIAVCNAPDGPTISTSEHALALLFAVAKRLAVAHFALRAGGRDFFATHDGLELDGKMLGLVGLGRIGCNVARIAQAIGMRVVAYDPYADRAVFEAAGVSRVDTIDELIPRADVVSLHLPLTAETQRLFDASRIGAMKQGAILINTARGGLVDHQALLDALESERLFGAGLDVTDPEPLPPDHPLLHHPHVVVTPHVAAATRAGKVRLYESAVRQALQVLEGQRPPYLVNPEVWASRRPDPTIEETVN